MFYLYILQNDKDSFYIGTTNNLERRLHQHNGGQSKYTKYKGSWKVVYTEYFETRSEAMKREYYLKSQKSKSFIQELINSNQ